MAFQYPEFAQKPVEKKGGGRTILLAGGLLAGVVCLGLVALGVALFIFPPGGQQAARQASTDIPTAREAYAAAVGLARQEDVGALLMTAAGAWFPVIDQAQLEAGRTGWTFYFYLPASQKMLAVVVDRVATPYIASTTRWDTPPDLLPEEAWKPEYDSGIKMPAFLSKCRGDLNAAPDRVVQAHLSTARDANRLLWIYQVMGPDLAVICEAKYDASTGAEQ